MRVGVFVVLCALCLSSCLPAPFSSDIQQDIQKIEEDRVAEVKVMAENYVKATCASKGLVEETCALLEKGCAEINPSGDSMQFAKQRATGTAPPEYPEPDLFQLVRLLCLFVSWLLSARSLLSDLDL